MLHGKKDFVAGSSALPMKSQPLSISLMSDEEKYADYCLNDDPYEATKFEVLRAKW